MTAFFPHPFFKDRLVCDDPHLIEFQKPGIKYYPKIIGRILGCWGKVSKLHALDSQGKNKIYYVSSASYRYWLDRVNAYYGFPQKLCSLPQIIEAVVAKELPFKPFHFKAGKRCFFVESIKDWDRTAYRLAEKVAKKHVKLDLNLTVASQPMRNQLIPLLCNYADVIEAAHRVHMIPKKLGEVRWGGSLLRFYKTGVLEKVVTFKQETAWKDWKGYRLYSNGAVQIGRFVNFKLRSGTFIA